MKKPFLMLLLVLLPVFWVHPTNAQSEDLKTAKEAVQQSYDKLVEVQGEQTLTKEEQAKQELEALIAALKEVVQFTITETESLIQHLSAIKGLSVETAKLQLDYLKELDEFLIYQQEFLIKITPQEEVGALTLVEIKQLALDFKNWRETVYDPEIKKIVSFIMVFKGSELLSIATSRFNKIALDLRLFQNSKLIKVDLLMPVLQQAGDYLKEASKLNQVAIKSLLATSTDPVDTNKLVERVVGLIKSSYGKFLEMSSLVKKMLNIQ